MNKHITQLLEQHFDIVFASPDGIKKLRELILALAMQGRLVPQDPNDQPASELLKEIEAEKQRLVKEGKIKAPKPLPAIKPEEMPYELPKGWEWVRLGDSMLKITDGTHHSPPNMVSGDFLYISAKNIKEDGVLLSNATYVTKEIHKEIYSRCDPEYGNILYIKDGATTGVVTINNLKEPFSMLSSVALLKQPMQINNRFLLFTLRSPFFYKEMRAGMTGVAITRVTLKKLQDALIPLPPLPEQHRIVAKIDQLMALCDTLERQIDAATGKRTELLNAVMTQV
jgi:type I restriction enzyme S subunit